MTTIKAQISNDLKDAMRAKDQERVGTLRLINAAIKQKEVDERIDVDDAMLLVILDKMVKQRKESITQFEAANRDDLVAKEKAELEIICAYLPEPLTSEEIEALVNKTIADLGASKVADMGKVMTALKPLLQGRADMSQVSALIKAKLG